MNWRMFEWFGQFYKPISGIYIYKDANTEPLLEKLDVLLLTRRLPSEAYVRELR